MYDSHACVKLQTSLNSDTILHSAILAVNVILVYLSHSPTFLKRLVCRSCNSRYSIHLAARSLLAFVRCVLHFCSSRFALTLVALALLLLLWRRCGWCTIR